LLVKCSAAECTNYKNGTCTAESITIIDVEEKENIKFKDADFMVCKSLKLKEY
jgi:hypothetical protein